MTSRRYRFPGSILAPVALALSLALPQGAQGAIINVSAEGRIQDTDPDGPLSTNLSGTNGPLAPDGLGDVYQNTFSSSTPAVGFHGSGHVWRQIYVFNLTAGAADVAAASSIQLSFTLGTPTGSPPSGLALVALTGTENAAVNTSDYEAAGDIVATWATPAANATLTADVTNYVKADALGTYSTFRLQLINDANSERTLGTHNFFTAVRQSATLTTQIPEPASLVLLAAGGLLIARRRGA